MSLTTSYYPSSALESLLSKSIELFVCKGIKEITMDDIAQNMGISKKTLYRLVRTKEQLVGECCQFSLAEVFQKIKLESEKAANAIDELLRIDKLMRDKIGSQFHTIESDIKHLYPEVYVVLSENRRSLVLDLQVKNLRRGILEGFYRTDINVDILAYLYYTKLHALMSEGLQCGDVNGVALILNQALHYHIRGIATLKGLDYLENEKTAK